MPHTIADKARRWTLELAPGDDEELNFNSILEKIEFLAARRFFEYVPTDGPHPSFMVRLRDWLASVEDEQEQKILFQLVLHIFFVGSKEFTSLYRAAYRNQILRWIIDDLGCKFDDPNLDQKLTAALRATWFCPITDSMQIAAFYHANMIESMDIRPDWRALARLGDAAKIIEYMNDKGVKRVVMLEDFVGSGIQITNAVEFAASLEIDVKILVVPLMICPQGVLRGKEFEKKFPKVRVSPVLRIPQNMLVTGAAAQGEPELFEAVRKTCINLYDLVTGERPRSDIQGPFGNQNTGALLVMHTNCPDNTLPLIHHRSETWNPLFPRSNRG